jgi:hypothetical protein
MMNSKIRVFFLGIIISILGISCSDAEIVSGVYKGRIYRTDTMNATATVEKINDSFIRIDVKADGAMNGYIEYAQLTKTADEAYDLRMNDDTTIMISGYYYENFLHINALASSFIFEGQSP